MTRCAHATVDPNSKKFERSHRSHPAVISEIPYRPDHRRPACVHGTSPADGVARAEDRVIVELTAPHGNFAQLGGHRSVTCFIFFPLCIIPDLLANQGNCIWNFERLSRPIKGSSSVRSTDFCCWKGACKSISGPGGPTSGPAASIRVSSKFQMRFPCLANGLLCLPKILSVVAEAS